MHRNIYIIWFSCFLGIVACTKPIIKQPTSSDTTELTGQILKKEWSKSTESFCAQGSEYYILKPQEDMAYQNGIVLEFAGNIEKSQVDSLTNQIIIARGNIIEKVIKFDKDELSQRPVTPGNPDDHTFICQVFKVKAMALK